MIITKQKSAVDGSVRMFFGSPSLGMLMASFPADHHGDLALKVFEKGLEGTMFAVVDADRERAPMTAQEIEAAGEFPISTEA